MSPSDKKRANLEEFRLSIRPEPTLSGAAGSLAPIALIELLQSPACLLDGAGVVVHFNEAWRKYSGSAGVGGEQTLWSRWIHPDDRYAAVSEFQFAAKAGKRSDFECRLRNASGTADWFLLSLQPLREKPDSRTSWLCIGTDIRELKRREADLEKRASIHTDMLNVSVDCIKLIALDGTLIHMNKAGCDALGVPRDSSFGMPWLPLLPEDVRERGKQALASARSGVFARFPGRSALPDQNVQHWDNMLTPMLGADGRPTVIVCVSREVTAEREALESFRESEERLAIAVRVGGLGVWDYNLRGDELRCDETWHRIMGRDPDRPVRSLTEFRPLIHPEDVERVTEVEQTAAQLVAAQRDYAMVFRIIRPDGEIRWLRSAACLIQDATGTVTRAIGFVVDITDARHGELALRDANRTLEEEKNSLARQSLEDPLTGIANRRHLDRELARICLRAGQAEEAFCVGLIDIDYFKAYNDRYGHPEGDEALRRIAAALRSVASRCGLVARYGGDEFAVVLTGLGNPEPTLARLAAAVAGLAIPHEDSATGYLTVSCGCAVVDAHAGLTPALILKASDEALYNAKVAGRDRYVVRSGEGVGGRSSGAGLS